MFPRSCLVGVLIEKKNKECNDNLFMQTLAYIPPRFRHYYFIYAMFVDYYETTTNQPTQPTTQEY